MTNRERFLATIERRSVDRPATWLGEPTSDAVPQLLRHFGAASITQMKEKLDDDVFEMNVPYHSPVSDHIAAALPFAKKDEHGSYQERTLTAPGFFEDYSDPSAVELFDWPDPANYIDRNECARRANAVPPDKACMVLAWSAHFQDACSAFGMETALVKMIAEPEMLDAVIDRITEFYLRANEIVYESTRGRLDAVLIGNDFGTQTGLLLAPELIRKHVLRGTKQFIDQAHSYNIKVIHHSCGSVAPVIPDLIATGADAVHPIQALAAEMDAETLSARFGSAASFCGGLDAQHLLVSGTAEAVYKRVRKLAQLFPTGLVISPSHEAILPDTKPANIEAMFRAAHGG